MTFLLPGLADFVVLSEDEIAGPPERFLTARVLLTVMDGHDTHREPGALPARTSPR